jgi:hypothetical protein
MPRPFFSRQKEIQRLRSNLECNSFPRLQMTMIVLLTGLAGFCTTALLHHFGWALISLRYLVAFIVAYGVFIGLLWVWLRTGSEAFDDGLDSIDLPSGNTTPDLPCLDTGASLDVGGLDEAVIPVLALAVLASLALLSGWLIVEAPMLFAELMVDGVLSASLYRRLRGLETRHWLHTAVRRTVWPFIITGVVGCALGWAMQRAAPEASTLGGVIQHLRH